MGARSRTSAVLLTYNCEERIVSTIGSLITLPERPAVIVVDNHSTDQTVDVIRANFPKIKLVVLEENIGAAARNIGVITARTPFVAFADADSRWEPGALAQAERVFERYPTIAVINAKVLVGLRDRIDPISRQMATSPLSNPKGLPGRPIISFTAGFSIVRRGVYLKAGGYDHRIMIGAGDDWLSTEILARGWDIIYAPEVISHHYPSRQLVGRKKRTGSNSLRFAWTKRPFKQALGWTWYLIKSSLHGHPASHRQLPAASQQPIEPLEQAKPESNARLYG